MTARRTFATTSRVLAQLRHDHRTIGIILVLPCVIFGLIAWMFSGTESQVVDTMGPLLIAIFPAVIMFLITSVVTLRERTSGTLERLMSLPISKADFLVGYALAFALAAAVQAVVLLAFAMGVCGMRIEGPVALMGLVSVLDAVLGSTLGLAASALARTEFQAVQLMPVFLIPQILVCGLLMPRAAMPLVLEWISRALPFTYAAQAMEKLQVGASTWSVASDIAVICAFIAGTLTAGIVTLRRRTA
ncbi:MAG: ABC transporter permease [Micrococcales bacterium]|nr:ABC transporter permease [Micrococcales bacterium]